MTQHWFATYVENSIRCVTCYEYTTSVLLTVFKFSKTDTVYITRLKFPSYLKTIIAPKPDGKLNYKHFCHLKYAVRVDNAQGSKTQQFTELLLFGQHA